ncbi:MAG: putative secreted protein [uncultured Arthrobacter sp.]|uniref:Putative secreted protein n=1 Tax=uncultured Arthrobacter sp. TaxID=114050 RepID=A0A6J4HMG4_9MICC|nr:HNH endonuclease family protein [uncultured Arthrobacter sp.]CAA9226449.1 MAG: putative secreted protein [uncultured Arthrobacter sp.]
MNIKSGFLALLAAGLLVTAVAPAAAPASAAPAAASASSADVTTLQEAVRALPVAAEDNLGFDRDRYFGHWVDADGDCQDTRAEVLVQESKGSPNYTSAQRCTVANSRWVTGFDNRTHKSATTVQIDHTVPAHEAWGSGARSWTQDRRIAFYNDLGYPGSLNAQPGTLTKAKQTSGPEGWVPPSNRCTYIAQWITVKTRWGLTVDSSEKAALVRSADACPTSRLSITKI